jgi:hypothetical protein
MNIYPRTASCGHNQQCFTLTVTNQMYANIMEIDSFRRAATRFRQFPARLAPVSSTSRKRASPTPQSINQEICRELVRLDSKFKPCKRCAKRVWKLSPGQIQSLSWKSDGLEVKETNYPIIAELIGESVDNGISCLMVRTNKSR